VYGLSARTLKVRDEENWLTAISTVWHPEQSLSSPMLSLRHVSLSGLGFTNLGNIFPAMPNFEVLDLSHIKLWDPCETFDDNIKG